MTTSKTKCEEVNDKIQDIRNNLGTYILGIKDLRIDRSVSLIYNYFEAANLHLWRCQMINNGFGVPPKIEADFRKARKMTELDLPMCQELCQAIAESINQSIVIIDLMEADFKKNGLEKVKKIFLISHKAYEEMGNSFNIFCTTKKELTDLIKQNEATTKCIDRFIDCLNDASNWINLHVENLSETI
jgi:hypothetical protein